jgi:hypothetical protein
VSYKIRNTIVLASVLFLISAAGLGYWRWWQPRELKKNAKEMEKIEKEIIDMAGLLQKVEELDARCREIKRKYDSRSKEIPTSDYSHQTYAYMSKAIDESGFLKFDMKYEGSKAGNNYGYNMYRLEEGNGRFESIYKFIYFLENGRRLYKIKSVTMAQTELVDDLTRETNSSINFVMEIEAFYSNIEVLATSLAAKSLTSVQAPFDPFNPLIVSLMAAEAPPNEINPDRLEIKAVLPGKAFALYGDELIVLHVGDKVWRGSVTRINPVNGLVEFQVDEGGLFKKVEKKIMFDKKKRPGI